MIVDFTITNFRSIKEEQTISFYAENKLNHHPNNISEMKDDINILKTCAIYGSNASGKTNILLAFKALFSLISESGDWKDGDRIKCYEPYLLSKKTKNEPTIFELEFYANNTRYRYEIHYNQKEILFEKLDAFFSPRSSNIFTRTSPNEWKKVKFGDQYKSGRKQIAFFPNNSYLSKAGNTPDSPEMIRNIFNFFRKETHVMLTNQHINILNWEEKDHTESIINTFLQKIDLGINKFEITRNKLKKEPPFPDNFPNELKERIIKDFQKKEFFLHESEEGDLIKFPRELESTGTQKLFDILPFYIEVIRDGAIIFIDEIESSLHPHIAELLIKLFNDPAVNKKNAQLIFTTHDLTLMKSNSMRKDQIYLTQKDLENGTTFDNLEVYDSSLKNNSPFEKWYDEGRLGNIPSINYNDISRKIRELF